MDIGVFSFNTHYTIRPDTLARALEERDIEASVNAILTVAATVNDLSGFGSTIIEKVLEVSGAASGVLYLPTPEGSFEPAVSLGA